MNRRRLLALLGSTALAGCGARDTSPSARPTTRSTPATPPSNVTVYTEARDAPERPDEVTRESAVAFVAEHEETLVYNELIGDGNPMVRVSGQGPATDVSVDPAEVVVLFEREEGLFLLSSCTGTAEYYCEGSCGSSTTRNASAVTHFVGPDDHVRVPYNAYACRDVLEPYAGDDPSENVELDERDAAAKVQLYDLAPGDHDLDVTVTHRASGDRVLDETFELSLPLTVRTDLTRRKGAYDVRAELPDGTSATGEWTVTGPATYSWTGLSVYVTPAEELVVHTVGGAGIDLPESLCADSAERRKRRSEEEG